MADCSNHIQYMWLKRESMIYCDPQVPVFPHILKLTVIYVYDQFGYLTTNTVSGDPYYLGLLLVDC